MKRRDFLSLAGAAATAPAWPLGGLAQVAARVPRIAFLSTPFADTTRQGLFQGLADYGYVDGKNITVEFFTAATIADMPAMAAMVVASRPDLIVTTASPAPLAAKALTSTIPIIFTGIADPVAVGLVSNLSKPGGNITGTTNLAPDLISKQVAILKDIVPDLKRLAVLGLPTDPPFPVQWTQVATVAQGLQIETVRFDATEGGDLIPLFDGAKASRCQAIYFITVTYLNTMVQTLGDLCLKYGFPAMGRETYPRGGVLVGYYGTGFAMDAGITSPRRGGYYIDLILKGARPGDLPVEGPTNFELVVNLKTAKALGVTIPQSVLFQATEVIQ